MDELHGPMDGGGRTELVNTAGLLGGLTQIGSRPSISEWMDGPVDGTHLYSGLNWAG